MKKLILVAAIFILGCSNNQQLQMTNGKSFDNDKFITVKEVREILKAEKERGGRLIGIGRTVFEGTKVESFEVEFVDVVLFGGFVKRPIYLARILATHPVAAKTGVAGGMSGSPIYVNGRLSGALAYGWLWQRDSKEQLIGITPIEFMLEDTRGLDVPKITQAPPSGGSFVPLSIPIASSGIRYRDRKLDDIFEDNNFDMVPMAGISSTNASVWDVPDKFEGGGFLGVQFARGDVNLTGYGTVTYVKGDTVIGFGHPMFGSGELQFPMTTGIVHTILASIARSSKVGSGGKLIGALLQDRDSCVVGRVGPEFVQKVKMIPVTVRVVNAKEKIDQIANVEIVNNKLYTPSILRRVIYGVNDTVEPSWLRERMIEVKVNVKLVGRDQPIKFENIYYEDETGYTPAGDGISAVISRLRRLLNNEWQKVEIERVDVVSNYLVEGHAKYLKEAWPVENEVADGADVKIKYSLKKRYMQDEIRTATFTLPKGLKKGQDVYITIGGAPFVTQDALPYNDVEGMIKSFEKENEDDNKNLVLQTSVQAFNFMYKGKIFEEIPFSELARLVPSLTAEALLGNRTVRKLELQDIIVVGSTTVKVRIK